MQDYLEGIGYQVVTPYYDASKIYTHAQAVCVVIASIRNSFVSQLRKGLQARRQGGFEGVRSNPPFDSQKILDTLL